jgi:type II secretory ATPase GspE/PulE/Tfp pilus assembly ATPase PilB-like protein
MVFNRQLRQLVAKGCSSEELQALAMQQGMLEFRRSAMVKVAMGVTSTEEILRELPTDQLGLDL